MSEDTPSRVQPTLFELPPRKAEAPPVAVSTVAAPAPSPAPTEAAPPPKPRRRWKQRGRTPLERIEHFQAWLRGDEQDAEPVPEGTAIYPPVYQLKVTLRRIRPPIWRRVLVPGNVTLGRLHRIIQNVMGWWNYHLYAFTIDGRQFSEGEYDLGFLQAAGRRLFELDIRPGDRFGYLYDFGDDWQHEVLLERVLHPNLDEQYPLCTAGARACPREDCGGVEGYAEMLRVLADPTDEEHESMLQWAGGRYDPERFDLEIANMRLRRAPLREAKSARDRALAWRALSLAQPPHRRQPSRRSRAIGE